MPAQNDTLKLNINVLVETAIQVVGSVIWPRESIRNMLKFCAEKDVYPIVEEFPFEEMPTAFEKLENGRPLFRCVVNMKDYDEKNGLKK